MKNLLDKAVYNNSGILSFRDNINKISLDKCKCPILLQDRADSEINNKTCFDCSGWIK